MLQVRRMLNGIETFRDRNKEKEKRHSESETNVAIALNDAPQTILNGILCLKPMLH